MTVVVDCGVGNLGSLVRALARAGGAPVEVGGAPLVARARRIVLPGVGCFDHAMAALDAGGARAVLERRVRDEGLPVLGICLGMQMLTLGSEEGAAAGLGWIAGHARRLRATPTCKVPHLGWNTVERRGDAVLFAGVPADACFYFAHGYAVECDDPADVAGVTEHGTPFVSAVRRGPVFGVQFHPEKSQAHGLQVLRNFVALG